MKKYKSKRNILVYIILMIAICSVFSLVVLSIKIVDLKSKLAASEKLCSEQKFEYDKEVEKLGEKNQILAKKVLLEEEKNVKEEEKQNPIGIPVSGQAIINNDPTGNAEDETNDISGFAVPNNEGLNPYTLEIEVEKGSKIIASGAGVVSYIGEDDVYGNIVKIDHGNGYVTVYRYDETPKINLGDEIHKGQMIFEVTKQQGVFAYHILFENNYINPFDKIEIVG